MNGTSSHSISIDGVVPRQVVEPETPDAFAAALAGASRDRLATVICGGGTKLDWGRSPQSVDLLVSTARLNRLIAHRHGDLTVTAQAGLPLEDLNRELRGQQQWLPVESAFAGATVGGIVATNDAGPSRHRNGTPRDLVIGITLALTDGRLIKAGGMVVKNVAGYDLGKLVAGSHGSLAGIADVTFKLVPMPHASATLVAEYSDAEVMARDVAALAGSQLEPAAFDVRADIDGAPPRWSLVARFASSPAATDAQVATCRSLLSSDARLASGNEETDLWLAHIQTPWTGNGAVVRFSWLPANLAQVLLLLNQIGRATLIGRAMGTGLLRIGGDDAAQVAAIARLRRSADLGHVVILRAERHVKGAADVWGPERDSDRVVRALKDMFDPNGILNAGRGPI